LNLWLPLRRIELASADPYVLFSATVIPFITSTVLGGKVMGARKKFEVPYPNLYATPGKDKFADDFNRVQRGHQSMFESYTGVVTMALAAGLKVPKVATACVLAFCVGSYFYQNGYADTTKDVKKARYTHPLAALKPLGTFGCLFACTYACYAML
jgi:glutathione S-transferase